MTSFSLGNLATAAVLVVYLSGCAPVKRTSQAAAPDGTAQRPRAGTTVTAEDIESQPGPIEMVLQARLVGVVVVRTADGIAVRIRGSSSLHGSNEPLYVLDGTPMTPLPNGTLAGLNPRDIASIEVLKDPAQTAMYGVRGANGVIVIKTKRGGR
jgi:TonB-dependent SusC/RagA subfamily outer membrane receptor